MFGIPLILLGGGCQQTVIVPEVVASELAAATNPTISAILKLGWVQIQLLSNSQLADKLQQERGLDAGEANAIALAIQYPPKSPLKRGTLRDFPPFLRGARGDR